MRFDEMQRPSPGFTLVELMLAMVLSLFLIGGAILLFSVTRTVAEDTAQLSRLQENVRFASDFLIRDIRNAGFDDVMTLRGEDARIINDPFAEIVTITNGSNEEQRLRIRFAGRGHCGQNFEQYRVVQNEYFVEGGELKCRGSTPPDPSGQTVTLLNNVSAIRFDIKTADGGDATSCVKDLIAPSVNPCLTVTVGLNLDGLDAVANPSVEFSATFRNAAMGLIYRDV